MPNRDGTGPLGRGPRTGRGLGPCASGISFDDRLTKIEKELKEIKDKMKW